MSSPASAVVHAGSTRYHQQLRALRRGRRPLVLLASPGMSPKDALAEARRVAASLGLTVHRGNLGQVASAYIGETEKNLGRLLEEATSRNAVLLFDEADALFGRRSDVRDAHDRMALEATKTVVPLLSRHATVIALAPPGRIQVSRLPPARARLIVKTPSATPRRRP